MSEEEHTFIIGTSTTSKTPPANHTEFITTVAASCHLPKGTRIEGFEIADLLGLGGFGLVYKAWDPNLEREVALKEYLPEGLAYRDTQGLVRLKKEGHKETFDAGMKSFVNEAKLLARFDHPALIKVFRFWESNGTAYMVMPYYKGKTLKARQASIKSLTTEEHLLDIILPLCDALSVMHQQHCIHRDVSPDNVIMQEVGDTPILLDFGAARRAIGQCGQSFTVILKSGYAPIEQYSEIPHYQQGPWTDVYALAALAHYLIRGKAPSPAVGRMVYDSYHPLAGDSSLPYTKHLLKALDWGLQIEPEKRPKSMQEFRAALLGTSLSAEQVVQELAAGDSLLSVFLSDSEPLAEGFANNNGRQTIHLTKKHGIKWIGLALIPITCLVYVLMAVPTEVRTYVPTDAPNEVPTESSVPKTKATESLPVQRKEQPLFERVLESASSDWNIGIETPMTRLRIDKDLLRLNITSAKEGYLTVWIESADGAVDELPVSTQSKPLKVKARKIIQVPDISEPLMTSGPAGKNRILVLISEFPFEKAGHKPLEKIERNVTGLMKFGAGMVEIEQIEQGIPTATRSPSK